MKTKSSYILPLAICLLVSIFEISAQNYYWSNNRKITIIKDDSSVLVKASENSTTEMMLTRVKAIESFHRINENSILVKINSLNKASNDELNTITRNRINTFKSIDGRRMTPTGEILLMPKKGIKLAGQTH